MFWSQKYYEQFIVQIERKVIDSNIQDFIRNTQCAKPLLKYFVHCVPGVLDNDQYIHIHTIHERTARENKMRSFV